MESDFGNLVGDFGCGVCLYQCCFDEILQIPGCTKLPLFFYVSFPVGLTKCQLGRKLTREVLECEFTRTHFDKPLTLFKSNIRINGPMHMRFELFCCLFIVFRDNQIMNLLEIDMWQQYATIKKNLKRQYKRSKWKRVG